MKIKKIIASLAAAAVAVSAMAVNAFAAEEYSAVLGFADTAWAVQDWETSTTVTGDGTYTLESTAVAGAADFGVFVIDFKDMFANAPEATAVLDKIEIDGQEFPFSADKIAYGDIEEKGQNFRIEIYNTYGPTLDNPGVNAATPIKESLKLTFTVSGLGGGEAAAPANDEAASAEETAAAPSADEAPAADTETTSDGTGNTPAAVMVSVMAAAGVAAIAAKKKK